MTIRELTHSQEILEIHTNKVQLRNTANARTREPRNKVLELLAADANINNLDDVSKSEEIQNEIEEADLAIQEHLQIILTGYDRPKNNAERRRYLDRKGYLQKHIGRDFSIIRGQCQKVLIHKMKSDPEWEILEKSGDPLILIKVTERHVLSQTENMYPFASVYKK